MQGANADFIDYEDDLAHEASTNDAKSGAGAGLDSMAIDLKLSGEKAAKAGITPENIGEIRTEAVGSGENTALLVRPKGSRLSFRRTRPGTYELSYNDPNLEVSEVASALVVLRKSQIEEESVDLRAVASAEEYKDMIESLVSEEEEKMRK